MKQIKTGFTDSNNIDIKVGDIIRVDVEINKETYGEYIFGVIEEDEEMLSGFRLDKIWSYCDLEYMKNPIIVGNIKNHHEFKETYNFNPHITLGLQKNKKS